MNLAGSMKERAAFSISIAFRKQGFFVENGGRGWEKSEPLAGHNGGLERGIGGNLLDKGAGDGLPTIMVT